MKTFNLNNFPTYALNYVVNSDCEGLTDEDIIIIDKYINDLAKSLDAAWIDFCDQDAAVYFSHYPEFGQACECCDMIVIYENN